MFYHIIFNHKFMDDVRFQTVNILKQIGDVQIQTGNFNGLKLFQNKVLRKLTLVTLYKRVVISFVVFLDIEVSYDLPICFSGQRESLDYRLEIETI